jgi:ubiquinone/menaquinone biosynthesis C-methylase UbiE/8-oxo-dGTP pyrophosphatase MutT (NUDIX family)
MSVGAEAQKSLTRGRFARSAHGYVTSGTHAKGAELARLLELASPRADWSVLDVATGGGHTALAFAPLVRHVVATDLTPEMLAEARAHILAAGTRNASFELADAEELPYAPATFHLVTCRIAPHHFPDVGLFVREAARVTRPGGLVLVQDQVVPDDRSAAADVNAFERMRDPSHLRALTETEWVAHFHSAGLEALHTEVVVKRHEFEPWARLQGATDGEVAALVAAMESASVTARHWLDPQEWGTEAATFVNRHLLILGAKPPAGTARTPDESSAGDKTPDESIAGDETPEQGRVRDKVVAYVTAGERLLVFRHVESPESGIQVPAGSIEPGETPRAAALREAAEETGLELAGEPRFLGERMVHMAPFGGGDGWQRRHFFHIEFRGEPPERWRHADATPSTGGPPVPFDLFWVPLESVPPLTAEQDALLGALHT